jgi:signal transduction histidine kinase
MRRGAIVLVVAGIVLLLGSYIVFTQRVVTRLRAQAQLSGTMYAEVLRALNDTTSDATAALFALAEHIRASGVPMVVTDSRGVPSAVANIPVDSAGDPRVREWITRLDKANPPVSEPRGSTVHFGHTPLVQGLRVIPLLQVATLVLLLLFGFLTLRTRASAERERVWAGMARESAHQLGTPLSSLAGWIELLRERQGDPLAAQAVDHMVADLERLERVSHRFERIGRPPQQVELDLIAVADRVADYFSARLPSLAHTVTITRQYGTSPLEMRGDPVLIEWALEALVKNAVDALAGRGGTIRLACTRLPEGAARVTIADDGLGVPRDLRRRIFDAGFSTKQGGWGIGLALTRRIVEDAHRGTLTLLHTDRGATFEIIFPA